MKLEHYLGWLVIAAVVGSCSYCAYNQPPTPTAEQKCRDACGDDKTCFGACYGSAMAALRRSSEASGEAFAAFMIGRALPH